MLVFASANQNALSMLMEIIFKNDGITRLNVCILRSSYDLFFDVLCWLNYNRTDYCPQYLIVFILPPPYTYRGEDRVCVAVYYAAITAVQTAKPPEWKNVYFCLLVWEYEN